MQTIQTAPSCRVVAFRLAGVEYVLPAAPVRELLTHAAIARVPHAHFPFMGVAAWEGAFLPVLDTYARLGLTPSSGPQALLAVEAAGEVIALLVDAEPLTALDLEAFEPGQGECLQGVGRAGERSLPLLELDALLRAPVPSGTSRGRKVRMKREV